ncbi:uncharacterized protein LOC132564884 [Ylistrum balloti]|uniref:uncharacterized protein LOC132564884 n=1 Tax=Ylistrum balloti TaxID=509963 RepID=UPI002905D184|nr:uncharacterized protein LOC132564884 [Ylistrum balloti]
MKALKVVGAVLARRDSGGGTVYHDMQNINICIISQADPQQLQKNSITFRNIMHSLGVEVELGEKNDMLYEGKKISGSAMRYTKQALLHHFTVLLTPNRQTISELLHKNTEPQIDSRAIASRRAEVGITGISYPTLLAEFLQGDYCSSLFVHNSSTEQELVYLTECQLPCFLQEQQLLQVYTQQKQRLSSTEWIYGRTPRFSIRIPQSELEAGVDADAEYLLEFKHAQLIRVTLRTQQEVALTSIDVDGPTLDEAGLRSFLSFATAPLDSITTYLLRSLYG